MVGVDDDELQLLDTVFQYRDLLLNAGILAGKLPVLGAVLLEFFLIDGQLLFQVVSFLLFDKVDLQKVLFVGFVLSPLRLDLCNQCPLLFLLLLHQLLVLFSVLILLQLFLLVELCTYQSAIVIYLRVDFQQL